MKLLLITLLAWIVGLISILLVSQYLFETPGFRDAIGFGGILLGGAFISVFLFYVPAFRVLKKLQNCRPALVVYPLVSACIANIPIYLLLWFQSGTNFGVGEGVLFAVGFFVVGLVFGSAYASILEKEHNEKKPKFSISTKRKSYFIGALLVILIAVLFQSIDFVAFRQNIAVGSVRAINSMQTKRSAHTATKLNNGKILLCGGIFEAKGAEVNNSTAELFDPVKEKFTYTGSMHAKRAGHTATLLPNGDVLVTGGFDSTGFLNTAEIYHPRSGLFEKVSSTMFERRAGHTATLLSGGKVLVAGGVSGAIVSNSLIELFDPAKMSFEEIGKLGVARTGHTATLLTNGNVLFCGGSKNWRSDVLRSCEIFDPTENKIYFTDSLRVARNKHAAVMLKSGNVLIAGGSSYADRIGGRFNSVELFEAKKGRFTLIKDRMYESRFKISNAADILDNGNVIIAGDGKYLDVFDSNAQLFQIPRGNVEASWMYPTVTTLQNGKVLITGGYNSNMRTTAGAWLFEQGVLQTEFTQAVRY